MNQKINKDLNLEIDLFACNEDEFIYFYLGLTYEVKKQLENAFYKGYTSKKIANKRPFMTHKEESGVTRLNIHPLDVFENRGFIKTILHRSNYEIAKR